MTTLHGDGNSRIIATDRLASTNIDEIDFTERLGLQHSHVCIEPVRRRSRYSNTVEIDGDGNVNLIVVNDGADDMLVVAFANWTFSRHDHAQ